jgi:lipopolysaccharide biosynthesis glycosyltransferase
LLNIANYCRLIIGNIINCDKLLYLDSDTIVQTDLSVCLDKVNCDNFVILGKRANLNFKNILNCNNINHAVEYFGSDFNLEKNVIFTGTLIMNPKKIKKYFSEILKVVSIHNSLEDKGGLYKLFTMSLINVSMFNSFYYFDEYINNVVDLGFRDNLHDLIKNSDVLDWSGINKPWFSNGFYREYWTKYNIFDIDYKNVEKNKDTIESF